MHRLAGALRRDLLPQNNKQVIAGIGCKLWENGRLSVGANFVTHYAKHSNASPWKTLPGIDVEVCESKDAFFIRPTTFRLEHCNPAIAAATNYLNATPYNLNVVSFNTEVPMGQIAGTFQPLFDGMELMQGIAEELRTTTFCKIGFGIGVPGQWRAPLQIMRSTPPPEQLKRLRLLNPFQGEEEAEMKRMFQVLSNTLDLFFLGRRQLAALEPRPEDFDYLTSWYASSQKKLAGERESEFHGAGLQSESSLENDLDESELSRRGPSTSAFNSREEAIEDDPEGDPDAEAYRRDIEDSLRSEDYAQARLAFIREQLGMKADEFLAAEEKIQRQQTLKRQQTSEGLSGEDEVFLPAFSEEFLEGLARGASGKEKKSKRSK